MISDRSIGIRKTIHDVCTVVQDMLKEVKNTAVIQILVGYCRATRHAVCCAHPFFETNKRLKTGGAARPLSLYSCLAERLIIMRENL